MSHLFDERAVPTTHSGNGLGASSIIVASGQAILRSRSFVVLIARTEAHTDIAAFELLRAPMFPPRDLSVYSWVLG